MDPFTCSKEQLIEAGAQYRRSDPERHAYLHAAYLYRCGVNRGLVAFEQMPGSARRGWNDAAEAKAVFFN